MTTNTLIAVQWRRGMFDFAGVDGPSGYVPFELHRKVMPTWRMNMVPAKATTLEKLTQAAMGFTEGKVEKVTFITDQVLAAVIKLANSADPIDLCPTTMFPDRDYWLALSMPVRLTVSDAHFPEPLVTNIQLIHVLVIRPNLLMVDLFDGAHRHPFTEAWSSESFDVNHCPVLDRSGGGRLIAALGAHIREASSNDPR